MLTVTSQGVGVDASLTTPAAPNEAADFSLLLNAASPGTILGTWCFPQTACGGGSLGAPLPPDYRSFAWPGAAALTRARAWGASKTCAAALWRQRRLQLSGGRRRQRLDRRSLRLAPGRLDLGSRKRGDEQRAGRARHDESLANWLAALAAAFPPAFDGDRHAAGHTPETPAPKRSRSATRVRSPAICPARDGHGNSCTPLQVRSRPRACGVWHGRKAGRAYAVGDEGAMWLWRSDTGLREPDPAAPLSFHANLTGIAFCP